MDDIINYLQNIQDDLVGLVLPVLITAFVALVTLLINTITQIVLQNGKFNNDQYSTMQNFYPQVKIYLLELKMTIQELENYPICSNLTIAIDKYIAINNNEIEYRQNHSEELSHIDKFKTLMNTLSTEFTNVNNYLHTCKIPRPPIMHPLLKRKINKMLAVTQYYAFLFCEYQRNAINGETLKMQLIDFKNNWKAEMDPKTIKEYIDLLDKWLMKY